MGNDDDDDDDDNDDDDDDYVNRDNMPRDSAPVVISQVETEDEENIVVDAGMLLYVQFGTVFESPHAWLRHGSPHAWLRHGSPHARLCLSAQRPF